MLNIVRFREILLEIRQKVNDKSEFPIDGIVLAVREGHMIKKLKDKTGIWLCGNFPDAELSGSEDNHNEKNQVLLFILEKVSSGQETDEEELQHYARLQEIMKLLKRELLAMDFVCQEIDSDGSMRTEWEFDVFGGWNGLSVGLKLVDYD